MKSLTGERFEFGDFELDGTRRTLEKCGTALSVNAKTLDLLLELVRNRGKVISKDELLGSVWPGQFVEENNLSVQISALRKIFGERPSENNFIATVPGRGYSFVAPIIKKSGPADRAESEESDPLIGREREIEFIGKQFDNGEARFLTLTGIGGSGKTRLARKIEQIYSSTFPGGVFFVELADVKDCSLLIPVIAEKLQIRQNPGCDVWESVCDFLSNGSSLLILDNFEQIIDAAKLINSLLKATTDLRILVTSRSPLRLNNEIELSVQPLEVPPAEESGIDSGALDHAAVQLFGLRAKNVRSQFEFTPANTPQIVEICRRLDGLPLSIELAAARIRLLSPGDILDRLQNSLGFLTYGNVDRPNRHQTIRDTIQWSFDLLDDDEKAVFRRLSVFAGGFTIGAAESILSRVEAFTWNSSRSMLDVITSLVENNLLAIRNRADEDVRLGMLEVVKEFASEQIGPTGELDDLRRAHALYFLEVVEREEPSLLSEGSVASAKRLQIDFDNIRAAINYGFGNEGIVGARIVSALRFFWINKSRLTEGYYMLRRGLAAAEEAPTDLRFKILGALGSISRLQGDYQRARGFYQMAFDEGTTVGDLRQISLSTAGLGTVSELEGDSRSARAYYDEALKISIELKDDYGIAIALNCLADLLKKEGKFIEAKQLLEKALTIYLALGNLQGACNNLNILGQISLEAGDDETAYSYYARSLEIGEELENKVNIIESFNGFAAIAARAGNPVLAAKFCGASEALRRSIGYVPEPAESEFQNVYAAKARQELGAERFSTAFEQGLSTDCREVMQLVGPGLMAIRNDNEDTSHEIVIETHEVARIIVEE